MKKLAILMLLSVAITAQSSTMAFCRGFQDGFRAAAGNYAMVPICPIAPIDVEDNYMGGYMVGVRAGSQ